MSVTNTKSELVYIKDGINLFIETLQKIMKSVKDGSIVLTKSSEEVNTQITNTNDNITSTSAALEQLSASMETVSVTVDVINEKVSDVKQAADDISSEASNGNDKAMNIKEEANIIKTIPLSKVNFIKIRSPADIYFSSLLTSCFIFLCASNNFVNFSCIIGEKAHK